MAGIGIFVAWLGYSLAYFGVDQVRGGNNGLLSLMIPGRYSAQPNDSGGGAAAPGEPVAGASGAPGGVATGGSNLPQPISDVAATGTPKGAPPGTYGVDPNGNIYEKVGGKWYFYRTATNAGTPQLYA